MPLRVCQTSCHLPTLPPPLEMNDRAVADFEAMSDTANNPVNRLQAAIVAGTAPRGAHSQLNRIQADAEWLREMAALSRSSRIKQRVRGRPYAPGRGEVALNRLLTVPWGGSLRVRRIINA